MSDMIMSVNVNVKRGMSVRGGGIISILGFWRGFHSSWRFGTGLSLTG